MADLLGAELPDLQLDLSGLELAAFGLGKEMEDSALPAESIPIAEEACAAEDAPQKENAEVPQAKSVKEEQSPAPAEQTAAETLEASERSSDFQIDYRTAALRNVTMIGIDDGNNADEEEYADAYEGPQNNTPTIEIYRAVPEDVDEIIELASEMAKCSRSPFRPVDEAKIIADRRADLQTLYTLIHNKDFGAFVARDHRGRLIGHVLVKTGLIDFLTGEEQAWIFDIAVQPKHWGSGISKKLLHTAEVFARERGIRYMGLTVTVSNRRALCFYQHAGYQEERFQMVKIMEPIDMEGNE